MGSQRANFIKGLLKESTANVPIYCTGYPEIQFIDNYIKQYSIKTTPTDFILYNQNYSLILKMGFDAISLWDFRRGEGGYSIDEKTRVDGWGRLYKDKWYLWDGVFKNEKIISNWNHLKPPSEQKLLILKDFLSKEKNDLHYVISLPGLFEKTWQSMGFNYFAKILKKNIEFAEYVISFFSNYLEELIKKLQNTGTQTFLIADDFGYKNRTFLSKETWIKLFSKKYEELINIIHERDQNVILHSDGYISDMIGIFIDVGFDAVQSLEPNSGVDIFSLFKKFQNHICFIGNLDMSLLSFGTPLQVRDYVTKLIKSSKKYNCSLIISPTHQITQKCNLKNINAMIQTTKIFK